MNRRVILTNCFCRNGENEKTYNSRNITRNQHTSDSGANWLKVSYNNTHATESFNRGGHGGNNQSPARCV